MIELGLCPRSSTGESAGLRIRRLRVRVAPGALRLGATANGCRRTGRIPCTRAYPGEFGGVELYLSDGNCVACGNIPIRKTVKATPLTKNWLAQFTQLEGRLQPAGECFRKSEQYCLICRTVRAGPPVKFAHWVGHFSRPFECFPQMISPGFCLEAILTALHLSDARNPSPKYLLDPG